MQVSIIGFGNMGQAIAKTLVTNKFKAKIVATDVHRINVRGVVFDGSFVTLPKADVVIIAVKPQDIVKLADEVREKINREAILVSIAAGVPIAKLQKIFRHRKVVRVMPNLGLLVGQGIAAWKSVGLTSADKKLAKHFLDAVCENFEVADEKLIDAVTAISGSGPAYFFQFADDLAKAGRQLGLSEKQSRLLVEKTFLAAAQLQFGQDYQTLIKKVRSKKGTTDAALRVFAKRKLVNIISEGVSAAHRRAKELSKG